MADSPVAATLYAVYFRGTGPNAAGYARLARVLEYSAKKFCPAWDIRIDALSALPTNPEQVFSHWCLSNTIKLEAWHQLVVSSPDGHLLLLTDVDMAVVAPLDSLLSMDFDLAYTTRPSRLPFNGGVLALRVNARTRDFMHAYVAQNRKMLHDPEYHKPFRRQFGGINQAAFGSLLGDLEPIYHLNVKLLPGLEWNCEQTTWHRYTPGSTRLLHVKSGLRQAILYGRIHAAIRPRTPSRLRSRRKALKPESARSQHTMSSAIAHWSALWYDLEREALVGSDTPLTDTK